MLPSTSSVSRSFSSFPLPWEAANTGPGVGVAMQNEKRLKLFYESHMNLSLFFTASLPWPGGVRLVPPCKNQWCLKAKLFLMEAPVWVRRQNMVVRSSLADPRGGRLSCNSQLLDSVFFIWLSFLQLLLKLGHSGQAGDARLNMC